MSASAVDRSLCAVCSGNFPAGRLRAVGSLTHGTRAVLDAEYPGLGPEALVCLDDLARFRRRHLEDLLERERGALTSLDADVLDSLEAGVPIVAEPDSEWTGDRTLGERAADALARFGGSWGFIFVFAGILIVWMGLNTAFVLFGRFDPYPFILLNLALSSLAALQAPVIMMSQRRQEEKDRLRSENDYRVNLKAELEIRHLHDKFDLHLARQWERLAAIQRLQIELLEETARDDRP